MSVLSWMETLAYLVKPNSLGQIWTAATSRESVTSPLMAAIFNAKMMKFVLGHDLA